MPTSIPAPALGRARKRIANAVLLIGIAIAASGCVAINGTPTVTQGGTDGLGSTVTFSIAACTNATDGADAGPCAATTNSGPPGFPNSGRVLLAVQLPTAVTPPTTVAATLTPDAASITHDEAGVTTLGTLHLARNTSYETALTAQLAPAAGNAWFGYVSEFLSYNDSSRLDAISAVTFTLPSDATGNTTIAQLAPTIALGSIHSAGAGAASTLPVTCGGGTTCAGDTRALTLALRTLTLAAPATTTSITQGSSATVPFTARLNGSPLPGGPSSVTTTSTIAGASSPAVAVTPSVGADTPISVQLSVPANAPVGPGTVTATLTTAGGATRTAKANIDVAAAPVTPTPPAPTPPAPTPPAPKPPTPPAPVAPPADPEATAVMSLTRCVTPSFVGSVVRFTTSEPLAATYLLQRRSSLGAILRKCPTAVLGGSSATPTFTTAARRTETLAAGTHLASLVSFDPQVALKPGAYRLVVQLRRAGGAKARSITQSFLVLAPAR